MSKNKLIVRPISQTIKFNNWLLLIFTLLGLIGILNHAMWRDELNPWLVARDSASLGELFQNIKYEGHPGLWYICLYVLNQFTSNPVVMQITHLIIASGFIYLFINFSPFNRIQKFLFTFGYLPFYEYLLISRNYAIGILILFAFCAFYNTRIKTYLILSVLLFILANSNAYCLFISVALGLALIVEYSLQKQLAVPILASRSNIICSLTIFLLGIILSLAQLIPPADSTLQGGLSKWTLYFDGQHLGRSIIRIWNSYIVILIPGKSILEVVIFTILALGLFIFTLILLIRKPVALFFYSLATLEIILFTYVKFLGSARHYGHLYIVLIVSFWIASYYPTSNLLLKPLLRRSNQFSQTMMTGLKVAQQYKSTFLLVILIAQLTAGIIAFSRDFVVPYSASRATASYIHRQKLDQMFIVGSRDATISPIAGYLNRKIYYPESQKLGSFVLFNNQRRDVDTVEVLEQVSQLNKQNPRPILLILNNELNSTRTDLKITFLSSFTKRFIHNEKYYLYRIDSMVKT